MDLNVLDQVEGNIVDVVKKTEQLMGTFATASTKRSAHTEAKELSSELVTGIFDTLEQSKDMLHAQIGKMRPLHPSQPTAAAKQFELQHAAFANAAIAAIQGPPCPPGTNSMLPIITQRLIPVRPAIQHYPWGSAAPCLVSRMAQSTADDPAEKWAEAWYGVHPRAPSRTTVDEESLVDVIAGAPALGSPPFLMKCLSVGAPLSIQAHPDSQRARVLHSASPDLYPDASHKPEMLLATKETELLCGFRPARDILALAEAVPSLPVLFGMEAWEAYLSAPDGPGVMACLGNLFNASQEALAAPVADLVAYDPFLASLHDIYGVDVGIVLAAILTRHTLAPGEAAFIPANIPHAYLSGEGIEIMACSDNVVRGGLTGKHVDRATLLEMLDGEPTDLHRVAPTAGPAGVLTFAPPVSEFRLITVTSSGATAGVDGLPAHTEIPHLTGPSFILCIEGEVNVLSSLGARGAFGQSAHLVEGGAVFIGGEAALAGGTIEWVNGEGRVVIATPPETQV